MLGFGDAHSAAKPLDGFGKRKGKEGEEKGLETGREKEGWTVDGQKG